MGKTEGGIELAQGDAAEHLFQVVELCLFGAQKPPSSRGIEEQITHGHGGATGVPGGRHGRRHIAPFHLHLPAFRLTFHIAGQGQPGYRTDRSQRLTTKPQGADGFQIIQPANLAGGMT